MSRSQRWWLIAAGVVATLTVGAGLLFLPWARPSNCGGNSAALTACKAVYISFHFATSDHGGPMSVTRMSASDRTYYFSQVAGLNWLGKSTVLVSPATLEVGESAAKEIIAVCDTAFDNVPQHRFGRAPLTHAVAYADGSTGLISVKDFERLNLKGFVDVKTFRNPKVEPESATNRNELIR